MIVLIIVLVCSFFCVPFFLSFCFLSVLPLGFVARRDAQGPPRGRTELWAGHAAVGFRSSAASPKLCLNVPPTGVAGSCVFCVMCLLSNRAFIDIPQVGTGARQTVSYFPVLEYWFDGKNVLTTFA